MEQLLSQIWIGNEVEGKLKGIKTLFIGCILNKNQIKKLADNNNCLHLYFNAGKREINDYSTIEELLDDKRYIITIETITPNLLPQKILKNCHIIWRTENNSIEVLKDSDTIKIESQKYVRCITKEQMMKNSFDEYNEDKVIC